MKKIVVFIYTFLFVVNMRAKEPTKDIIGMLIFLDRATEIASLSAYDYNKFMIEEYNYEVKQLFPYNTNRIKTGFEYYSISNGMWNGVIATWNDSDIYKLKGFSSNDFSIFFSNYKYECNNGVRKISDKRILKSLEGLGVDFKCLYDANKRFECTIKEKHSCAMRKCDIKTMDEININCFK